MLRLLLLAIALIVYGSLYPFQFEITDRAATPLLAVLQGWPDSFNRFVLRDVFLNVAIYLPLGLAAAGFFLRRHRRRIAIAAALVLPFALSLTMELLQVYEPRRDPSALDVLSNTLGAALGVALAVMAEGALRRFETHHTRELAGPGAALLLVWAVAEFFPLIPALGRTHVAEILRELIHRREFSPVEMWLGAAEWFAVALALRTVWPRLRFEWLAALAGLSLAAQLVINERALTLEEILAAALGLLLWYIAPDKRRARWSIGMLASAILLRELQPFYLLAVPQRFSWIPFAATLESSREGAVIVIARKAFDYGAMIFALHTGANWKYPLAGAVTAAALFVTEAIETYLPGRTPEITDSIVAVIMMAILAASAPKQWEQVA